MRDMPTIPVDEATYSKVQFAARLMGCPPGEVVRRLVDAWSAEPEAGGASATGANPDTIAVHAVYRGRRVEGTFDRATRTVTITTGPGAKSDPYNSPSAAAGAVLRELNPERNANTNGWRFWRLDSNGTELQTVRFQGPSSL